MVQPAMLPCHAPHNLKTCLFAFCGCVLLLLQTPIQECLDQQAWPALGQLDKSKAARQQEPEQVRLFLQQHILNRQGILEDMCDGP
jgi:hypothetical protein